MAKSGCLVNLKSDLIKELYKVNMSDDEFLENQKLINESIYSMYMNTKIIFNEKDISELSNSDFTNHSGGAFGSDIEFDNIGKEYGFDRHNHYYYGDISDNNAPHGNTRINARIYNEGKIKAAEAAKRNWGYDGETMSDPRLVRNWSQVKNSTGVYAISTIVGKGKRIFPNISGDDRVAIAPSVTGGTGYAVGMAIVGDQKVFVFNQESIDPKYPVGWYQYDKATNDFISTETPTLTKDYAGIGTREINDSGKKAIRDLYENTLSQTKSKDFKIAEDLNIYSTDENGYESLSNLSPREFTFEGKNYHSVEHAYQTLKSGTFDNEVFEKYNERYNNDFKLGKITGSKKVNTNISYELMKNLIKASLEQNQKEKDLLLSTGDKNLTHTQESSNWKNLFPKALMEVRDSFSNKENNTSGSGPKEWIDNTDENVVGGFNNVSVADFVNNIDQLTGDLRARTDNENYHNLISGLMGLIQNTLKDAEFVKTLDVVLLQTKDIFTNARFMHGENPFYGQLPDGTRVLETGDKLELRYGQDVDLSKMATEANKYGYLTMLDDYTNGLQGSRELMVHDMLHGMIDTAMHLNKDLYDKASAIQRQYSKYITVKAMVDAMKARSGFDATASQIEQMKDIVNYVNGSPVEFMMYALTNPMVYEIMENAGKVESAKYDLINTSGREVRDKRNPKTKFTKMLDKFVDIINNTYRLIKIGRKAKDGSVIDKDGLDVLKDVITAAAIKNLEGMHLDKAERERLISGAKYDDWNLGGKFNLSDTYKDWNDRLIKFNEKSFSKLMQTDEKYKFTDKIEQFGSWMNKFEFIKDNREKGRFRLFSDVVNTIVEDTTSQKNGAADFYKIFRAIKGSRDRDKVEMIQTSREMLDRNWIDVPKDQRESMSYFMQTDWKSSGLSLDEYADLLNDRTRLDAEINTLKNDVGITEYNENAKFLGYYMVHGVSKAPELMRNANMIVNRSYGEGHRLPLVSEDKVSDTISKVDRLATLYAMKYLDEKHKDNIVKTIKEQNQLVQATSNLYYSYSDDQTKKFAEVGLDKYIMKGYVKKSSVVDMKFEMVEASKVRRGKYTAHTEIRIDDSVSKIMKDGKTYYLVVSRDYDTSRTQGGFDDIHIIDKQLGLRDVYSGSEKDTLHRMINKNAMFKDIQKDNRSTSNRLSVATSDDINDIAMLSDNLIPSYDVNGNVIDYEIPISNAIRREQGREINDIANTVAQTISHINSKENAISNNRLFADMLIEESDKNAGKPGYVLLRPTTDAERNAGVRHRYDEEWAMIPSYIQEAILMKDSLGENARDGLWVKEGRINNIIGYKDPSLANLKLFGKDLSDYPNMQRAVQVMENYWKAISSRYKEVVVKYFPTVVWANMTSNMWVAFRHGIGPIEYAKSFTRHWSALSDYLETVDEINRLKFENRSGFAKNDNRIKALEDKLVRNPFNLLIKDGQFSTIMEDLDMSGMTKKSHIEDYIDGFSSKFNKVGSETKDILSNVYATRGSSVNRAVEKLTIFNDIINRSIIMERMMQDLEKISFNSEDDKTAKIQEILNYLDQLFVNYSYLDNKYLKYANDTIIFQFTKYLLRALKANVSMMTRNPLAAVGFESFDTFAYDLSDSFDQYGSPVKAVVNRFMPSRTQAIIDVVTPHTAAAFFG